MSEQPKQSKQTALLRILQITSAKSAKIVTYTAALLGMAALVPSLELPPELVAISGGLGIEALGSLLDRISTSNDVSDREILKQVEKAVAESGISKILTKDDFYHAFAHLRKRQRVLYEQNTEILRQLKEFLPDHPEPLDVVKRRDLEHCRPTVGDLFPPREDVFITLGLGEDWDTLFSLFSLLPTRMRNFPLAEILDKMPHSDPLYEALNKAYRTLELKIYEPLRNAILDEPLSDGTLEIVSAAAIRGSELDVKLRNTSGDTAYITRLSVRVLKDYGALYAALSPSAQYTIPISHLAVGETQSLDISHIVEPHGADRFLIALTNCYSVLLIRLTLEYNRLYSISENIWLGDARWVT